MIFKKFSVNDVSSQVQLKQSVARGIRNTLEQQYPYLAETGLIEVLLPKKAALQVAKCQGKIQILLRDGEPLFFCKGSGPWCPALRLVHQYPEMAKRLRVDVGAIKFVLAGADIMCPGLTSAGATMHDEADVEDVVSIYAEGKEHALAIGIMKMSTEDIRNVNKGHGVENIHYLTDGLWHCQKLG